MFEQFLSDDIGCGPFFDHIKRWFFEFEATTFWSSSLKGIGVSKTEPRKVQGFIFRRSQSWFRIVLSINLTSKLCHKVILAYIVWQKLIISQTSFRMIHIIWSRWYRMNISHGHVTWLIWYGPYYRSNWGSLMCRTKYSKASPSNERIPWDRVGRWNCWKNCKTLHFW